MFKLNQIKEAHSRVKSDADFPKYAQDLIFLGVLKYSIYVVDGHAEYIGKDNYRLIADAEYPMLNIAIELQLDKFKHYLKIHQQGETDYLTFCKHSAETGIEKWIVDILSETCTYYDKSGNSVLVEKLPI